MLYIPSDWLFDFSSYFQRFRNEEGALRCQFWNTLTLAQDLYSTGVYE